MLIAALALSVVGLALGPLFVALGRGRAVPAAAVDGLTIGVVPALICVRLLPHAFESLGPLALGLFAAGYLALWSADRWGHRMSAGVGQALIVPTLALHAATDGAGLAVATAAMRHGASSAGLLLGAALLMHRVPEGLFLASTFVPTLGWTRTLRRLAVVAGATVAGGLAGGILLAHVSERIVDGVVALGLGAMLRLALHSHAPRAATPSSRFASSAGLLIGLIGALAIPTAGNVLLAARPGEWSFLPTFVALFVDTAPWVLIGLFAASLMRIAALGLRGRAFGSARSSGSGSVATTVREAVAANVSTALIVVFVLGAAQLEITAVAMSFRLLGGALTAVRLGVAGIGAAASLPVRNVIARAVERTRPSAREESTSLGARAAVARSIEVAGAPLLAGLAVASMLEAALPYHAADGISGVVQFAAALAMAIAVGARSIAVTPVAAVLLHKGCAPGAVMAFVILAPTVSRVAVRELARARGLVGVLAYLLASTALAAAVALVVERTMGAWRVPALHGLGAHSHGTLEYLSALALAALLLASLLRAGARDWFGTLLEPPERAAGAMATDPPEPVSPRSVVSH